MRIAVLLGVLLVFGAFASAQGAGDPPKKMEELIAEATQRMNVAVDITAFQEKMPFAKFLKLLEKEISKEKKFTLHFDRDAFGKDADGMLKAEVALPPIGVRMVAATALRLALGQANVPEQEIEYTARPGALVIATRDRSLFTVTYEIRDLLKQTHLWHKWNLEDAKKPGLFGEEVSRSDLKADPTKPVEFIVRQIIAGTLAQRAGWHKRTPASTIRVVNETKLVVHTVPSVHAEIVQLLESLRRLADLAVVMNAKVYSLDPAEYAAHFASAFIDPKDKTARRLVATITTAQWKKFEVRKPILESDPDKLRPDERADFLTQKNVYQFQAQPSDSNATTAFEGFSFAVRPTVSADRRCIRLELFHNVAQLVKLTKGMMVDLKTGKDMPIELPNIRKSAATGTIEIHDGEPILLAVDYQPKDKVWLVVAEPRIYIEEEEEQIRKGAIPPMLLADEKPAPPVEDEKPFVPPPLVELPSNDDVKQILQAVVENILIDPEHKKMHAYYGTPGDTRFTLIPGYEITWPKDFRPSVAGFLYQHLDPDECRGFKERKRLLGIRLDTFAWTAGKANPTGASVVVVLNDAIHGGLGALRVVYEAKRDGKRWRVKWTEAHTR